METDLNAYVFIKHDFKTREGVKKSLTLRIT